ncbi:unnamed protein product [Ranitomeya imitator]|uniref:Tc1-like transposase DDE domain-containing protein n=1 Tax=Ranitomeya imitator TaxID=111125 RepID=A0ABN9MF13_9NEOB|nr:unnamed protein product [Ranitomeya imitator]
MLAYGPKELDLYVPGSVPTGKDTIYFGKKRPLILCVLFCIGAFQVREWWKTTMFTEERNISRRDTTKSALSSGVQRKLDVEPALREVCVIILYPKCQCHYPVPQVSASLSCTPSVSVIILYPKCQCHYPVPKVVSVIILYPKCQCHYPVPQVSVSLSCTPSVSVIILYPKNLPVLQILRPSAETRAAAAIFRSQRCIAKLPRRLSGLARAGYGAHIAKYYMDNDPKHNAKATQEFIKAKKCNILEWPSQSPDLNPIEHAFHLLKTKLHTERPTNKQQLKTTAVKAWQSIKKEETQRLVFVQLSEIYYYPESSVWLRSKKERRIEPRCLFLLWNFLYNFLFQKTENFFLDAQLLDFLCGVTTN